MNSTGSNQTISVLIPTFNGEKTLEDLFITLGSQTLQPLEVLVADSSSVDGTVAICEKYGAKIVSILKSDFDHGGTRTYLAKQALGDILVFFTQDATLVTRNALSLLLKPLIEDDSCASSFGRQLPRPDANWHAAHLRRFNYPEESYIRTYSERNRYGLRTIFTSNSFAAYKKERLSEVDYFKNGLIFGEDTCTVGRIIQAGYTHAYVGDAEVYHSHNYSLVEEFRRSFDIGVLHSSEKWLLNTFGTAENIGFKYAQSAIKQMAAERRYLFVLSFSVRTGLKFFGYKLGRVYKKLPLYLRPVLSMNSSWWHKK